VQKRHFTTYELVGKRLLRVYAAPVRHGCRGRRKGWQGIVVKRQLWV
jgi:hypothetical protein